MPGPVQIVCGTCGSTDVLADAYGRWNSVSQEWELTTTFDKGSVCEVCEGECRLEEIPFSEWDAHRTESELVYSPHLGLNVEVGVVFYDDENKWRGQVSEEDVGGLWSSRLLYDDSEEAKDHARRWARHEGYDDA